MLITLKCLAASGTLSTLIEQKLMFLFVLSLQDFSNIGLKSMHGLHQVAQKSIMTPFYYLINFSSYS
jgi:hypothetical protein